MYLERGKFLCLWKCGMFVINFGSNLIRKVGMKVDVCCFVDLIVVVFSEVEVWRYYCCCLFCICFFEVIKIKIIRCFLVF